MSECSEIKKTEVIIVGAGFAGITAALKLVEEGIEVIVLEARNRVGGRVFSIENEQGIQVDLGAQWIGPSMKRMHRLIEQEGLTKVKTYHKGKSNFFLADKVRFGHGDLPPLSPLYLADVWQFINKVSRKFRHIDPVAPWNFLNANHVDAENMASFIENNVYTQMGKAYWRIFLQEALCMEPSEVSLLDVLWGWQTNGTMGNTFAAEKEWIKESAYSLIVKLASKLRERVLLQSPVRSIEYNDDTVCIKTDKDCWVAKRVIVAVPPELAGRITYIPPMPPRREKLTQVFKQGAVFKCIISYDCPFWRQQGHSGIGYYEHGPVKATLDSSPPDRDEGVLIALVSGNDAKYFSRITGEQRKKSVLSCLEKAFGIKAQNPLSYIDKDWSADEWSMGGYGAHFKSGMLTAYGPSLYEPIGAIHWAGSETATEYRLFMEGAIQSGERAATEVLHVLDCPGFIC
ncbi:flavin monoamine oxidase family protein [Paenibacillus agricola]|uniref:NAD(P)-binding protein n=1 Tax=Paenibacillus agricola TaxID=2716264 RepID=A0ABX0IWE1_9BACL|nr:FAD-dependent oxidoreductase [Paenibacillus agricola]NHN28235.1 NAD(P)-binding protein [Paenibacillus agricola]